MSKGMETDAREDKNGPDTAGSNMGPTESELNGRLIRVVNVSDLKGYISYRSSDTGHIVYTVRGVDGPVEYHILIIGGKPVAASSEKSRLYGSELIDSLNGVAGTAEYYFIEEEIIRSVLDKYPRIAVTEGGTGQPITSGEEIAAAPVSPEETVPGDNAATEEPDGQADDAGLTVEPPAAELIEPEPETIEPVSTPPPEAEEKNANAGKKTGPTSNLDSLLRRLKLVR